jgi:hypothetical protein
MSQRVSGYNRKDRDSYQTPSVGDGCPDTISASVRCRENLGASGG